MDHDYNFNSTTVTALITDKLHQFCKGNTNPLYFICFTCKNWLFNAYCSQLQNDYNLTVIWLNSCNDCKLFVKWPALNASHLHEIFYGKLYTKQLQNQNCRSAEQAGSTAWTVHKGLLSKSIYVPRGWTSHSYRQGSAELGIFEQPKKILRHWKKTLKNTFRKVKP